MTNMLLRILFICCFGLTIVSALDNGRSNSDLQYVGPCVYARKLNIANAEEQDEVESLSDRAYPFLNCSSFNKTLWESFNFNGTVQGFLLDGNNNNQFSLEDLSIFGDLKTIELHEVIQLKNPATNATSLSSVTSLSMTKCNQSTVPVSILQLFPNLMRLTLSRNNITTIGAEDFHCCPNLKSIDLGHNPITSLNTSWLNTTVNVERLALRAIDLKDVGNLFREARYLKFLDLSDNSITYLRGKPFRSARSLTTLILANNKISEIERNAFKGPFDLSLIDLTENSLKTLEARIFDFQPSHELTVELWENPINCNCGMRWLKSWIDNEQAYGSYPDVRLKCHNPTRNHGKKFMVDGKTLSRKELTCQSSDKPWKEARLETPNCTSQISTASSSATTAATTTRATKTQTSSKSSISCPKACQCYSNAKHLPTHYNSRVTDFAFPLVLCHDPSTNSIPTNLPDGTKGLVVMGTSLDSFDVGKLRLPSSLTTLVLKKNQISKLVGDQNVFFNNTATLGLQDNHITNIPKQFLASFPNLSKLSLFNNKITEIADDTFEHNRGLKKLLLGPNPMKEKFTGKSLIRLKQLVKLQLRGMKMKRIPLTIKNKRELASIDLSDNQLTIVPRDSFVNCSQMNSISLENNNISVIEPRAFSNLPNLLHLDLSENALTTLPSDLLVDTLELSHVELWQNPIQCDCHLEPFVAWVKQMEHDNPATEIRFRCEEPFRMRGKTSDETQENEYICKSSDNDDISQSSSTKLLYTQKDISIAIGVSVLVCVLAFIVLQVLLCRCKRFRNYRGKYFEDMDSKYRFSVLSASSGNGQSPIINEENDAEAL